MGIRTQSSIRIHRGARGGSTPLSTVPERKPPTEFRIPLSPENAGLIAVGDRLELIRSADEFTSLAPGARGTVSLVDALGTVHMDWDDGGHLGLVLEEDRAYLVLDLIKDSERIADIDS